MTYGLYAIGVWNEGKATGCLVNTVFQITAEPVVVAVSISKDNFTHDLIVKNKRMAASILSEGIAPSAVGMLGYQSGRNVDKNDLFRASEGFMPVLKEGLCGYLELEVTGSVDMGTHTVFMASVAGGECVKGEPPMTYAYYHKVLKGKASKNAPTYMKEEVKVEKKIYVCDVCGYEYDEDVPFDQLPDDWTCPICGVGKDQFSLKE